MSKICKKPANKGTEENLWLNYGHHAWSLNEEVPVKVLQKRKNVEIRKKDDFSLPKVVVLQEKKLAPPKVMVLQEAMVKTGLSFCLMRANLQSWGGFWMLHVDKIKITSHLLHFCLSTPHRSRIPYQHQKTSASTPENATTGSSDTYAFCDII